VKKITRPNNTVREINYDDAGQTMHVIERTSTGGMIAFRRLNWDNAARVEWEYPLPQPQAYTPPTRTMTFDNDNRIALFNGSSVTHDSDGNLTSGPLTNDTFVTYSYDARNRLTNAAGVSYTYDPAGNRVALTNGGVTTRFAINPNAALSQVLMRVKGGVTNYYIYGLGLQYEITETATTTNTLTYHYDYRGSTVALTDGSGNVTDRIEYSPYATTTYRSGTNDTPFLYNGRYGVQTDSNGLLYMRARYYNPYICRFLNPDPSGFSGGLNFYAYADGNPISLIDPFGLGASEAGWGSQFASWIDRNATGPLNSVSSSSTLANWGAYNVGSVVGGFADLFRLGEGTANATYNAHDGYDVAIGITQDVGRAAGISLIVGGGLEGAFGRSGTTTTTALSPYRVTTPGETFIRYESANPAFTRVTPSGGVTPGTFAAPASDGLIPLANRVPVYNLPSPQIPRPNAITLTPPPGTSIIGPRPVMGGTGNEVIFPMGY
jgi:RHS repeat-associated protein